MLPILCIVHTAMILSPQHLKSPKCDDGLALSQIFGSCQLVDQIKPPNLVCKTNLLGVCLIVLCFCLASTLLHPTMSYHNSDEDYLLEQEYICSEQEEISRRLHQKSEGHNK